jgi:proton-translocating NADH-quinone oxidoreductase chain L
MINLIKYSILVFPLLSACFLFFFNKIIYNKIFVFYGLVSSVISSWFSFVFSIVLIGYAFNNYVFFDDLNSYEIFKYLNLGFLNLSVGFNFDAIVLIMIFVITSISFLVQVYSFEYLRFDGNIIKFFIYLNLFAFFMLIFVSANNLVQAFLGWEGVGLVSFLLIGFWDTRIYAVKAAFKAILVNRVGDIFFFIGIIILFYKLGTVEYIVIFDFIQYYDTYFNEILFGYFLNYVALFLFIGIIAKSAQLGLHTWLPDAMEGPTPVSALIHAATMVTAGIFLLIRMACIFEFASWLFIYILLIGGLTAFLGASVACFQNDIKKVIAYSTCSQLGYMMAACGTSNYLGSLFHLVNHAFFKALLFLGSGIIIHALFNEQDMRRMGGLKKLLPFNYVVMGVGFLSLMGFPFLSGFYSKDNIIEVVGVSNIFVSEFIYILLLFSAFFTALYSFRYIYFVYFAIPKYNSIFINYITEKSKIFSFVVIYLLIFSVLSGYVSYQIFLDSNLFSFQNLIIQNNLISSFDVRFELFNARVGSLLPVIYTFSGLIVGYISILDSFNLYIYKLLVLSQRFRLFLLFFFEKWFFDLIYARIFVFSLLRFSNYIIIQAIEQFVIQWVGSRFLILIINFITFKGFQKYFTNGNIFDYFLIVLISLFVIIFVIVTNL